MGDTKTIKKSELDLLNYVMPDTRNKVVCTYYEDKKPTTVYIDLTDEEHTTVVFEKGYVIVRTEVETKFVCKGKSFISLWR